MTDMRRDPDSGHPGTGGTAGGDIDDTGEDAPDEDDEPRDPGPRLPLSDLAFARSLLRAAAIVALALWVIGIVASAWFQWAQLEAYTDTVARPTPRLAATISAATTQAWGYLLVAVVAFAASLLVPPGHVIDDEHDPEIAGPDAPA